jgi:hypothetical protein
MNTKTLTIFRRQNYWLKNQKQISKYSKQL